MNPQHQQAIREAIARYGPERVFYMSPMSMTLNEQGELINDEDDDQIIYYEDAIKDLLELDKIDQWVAEALKRPDDEKKRASFLHTIVDHSFFQYIDYKLTRGDVKKLYTAMIARDEHSLNNACTLLRLTQFNSLAQLKLIQDTLLPKVNIRKSDFDMWKSMLSIENCIRLKDPYRCEVDGLGFGVLSDPFSVAQVPWCPAKFNYWLLSAMNMSNAVDLIVKDFVLWPFPKKFVTPMLDMLYINNTFRERVLFGYVLLGAMVNQFPNFDPKIPRMIMDEVLLPCIPLIDWYANRGAAKLRSFKRLIWNGEQNLKDLVQPIPDTLFEIEPELVELSSRHVYSYRFWVNLKRSKPEFVFSNAIDYKELCARLNNKILAAQKMQQELKLRKFIPGLKPAPWEGIYNEQSTLVFKAYSLLVTHSEMIKIPNKGSADDSGMEKFLINVMLLSREQHIKNEIEELFFESQEIFGKYNNPIVIGEEQKYSNQTIFSDFKRCYFRRMHAFGILIADKTVGVQQLCAQNLKDEEISFEDAAQNFETTRETKCTRVKFLQTFEANKPTPVSKRGFTAPINKIQIRIQDLMGQIVTENFKWLDGQLEPFPLWQFTQYYLPTLAATIMWKAKSEVGEKAPAMENMVKFLEALVQHCESAFEKHQENPKKLSTTMESEATYEEFAYNLTAMNVKSQELNCLLDWFFLGKNRKNIFTSDLFPIHQGWAPMFVETTWGLNIQNRQEEANKLGTLYKENPSEMKKFLCGNNLAAREAKERYEMLLEVARRAFGLPVVGSPILGEPRLTKLYEAMTILTEADILVALNKQYIQEETEKVEPDKGSLITCKFYQEWNCKQGRLGEVDKLMICPKYTSGLFRAYPKSVIEGSMEGAFKNECTDLAKYRLGATMFAVPEGLKFSNYPDHVVEALESFKAGDVRHFQRIINDLLMS